MSASITNDKLRGVRNGGSPEPTTVASARSIDSTSLSCVALTNWFTDTPVDFITYQKKSDGTINPDTLCVWEGIVSGTTIGSLTLKSGTDAGNSVGDFVEAAPTDAWAQDLYDGLTQTLNTDGTLKDSIVTTAKLADSAVTTAKVTDKAITTSKWTNPYTFCVYKGDSWTTPNNTTVKINFNAEEFDTNSNFDSATNYRYNAPVNGIYKFYALASFGSSSNNTNLLLYKNGSLVRRGTHSSSGSFSCDVSGLLELAAGDYVEVYIFSSATATGSVGSGITYFEGHLVTET